MKNSVTAEKAMTECVDAIRKGARQFDHTIGPKLLSELRSRFRNRFQELFKKHPRLWRKIRTRVLKMARYLGAGAALNADADEAPDISKAHLFEAARHIKKKCPVRGDSQSGPVIRKAVCQGVDLEL